MYAVVAHDQKSRPCKGNVKTKFGNIFLSKFFICFRTVFHHYYFLNLCIVRHVSIAILFFSSGVEKELRKLSLIATTREKRKLQEIFFFSNFAGLEKYKIAILFVRFQKVSFELLIQKHVKFCRKKQEFLARILTLLQHFC